MKNSYTGISCSLPEGAVNKLLLVLSQMPYKFHISWLLDVSNPEVMLPEATKNFDVTGEFFQALGSHTIWELVFHIYPVGVPTTTFETYEDFARSKCLCCMIYYDCGWLDIYIKDEALFSSIHSQLEFLGAEDFRILTGANDGRTVMHL